MTKFLVNIEYRYTVPETENDNEYTCYHRSITNTIGIYDTNKEAVENGNKLLEVLESQFELNPYNGKSRFSVHRNLVSNLGYLKTPFDFYALITKLEYRDIESSIQSVLADIKG